MKPYLSTGGTKRLACIFKGLKKGLNVSALAGTHCSRGNTQLHCRHGQDAFVVLFVAVKILHWELGRCSP